MALTFVGSIAGPAGTPLHVTIYDGATQAQIDPATVTWSVTGGLPAGVTITPDATGFNFNSTVVKLFTATASSGISTGSVTVNFTAPPLKFTAP